MPGAKMPPVAAGSPLDDVRQLRSEVAALGHMLAAERANAEAWRLRAEANDALLEVEESLWRLCETYRRQNRKSHDERTTARFDAEMEMLRAQYPLLRETT